MSRAKSASTRSIFAPAFALAIGAAGHDAAEPLDLGLLKGWRGRIAFQALRGTLPGGGELRPVSGVLKSDGQSLTFEAIKGKIGGGEASATIDARQSANGIALNARVQISSVDGTALRYRSLAMPAGRASMQMTLASQGRSASALAGALSGSGTLTLEFAAIAGLDPRAFEVAIRASDSGQATDDVKLKQIVEPVLSAGVLSVGSAQIPFNIRDGRLRVGATTLDAKGRQRHHIGRIRYSRRPGRHPRQPGFDGGGGCCGQPSGDSIVRGGFARRARPHRRRGGAVVLAGGARDRSRNPPAGFDRARRTAAAIARGDSTRGAAAPGAGSPAQAEGRSRSGAGAAQSQSTCRQPAGGTPAAADRSPPGSRRGETAAQTATAAALGADAAAGGESALTVLQSRNQAMSC